MSDVLMNPARVRRVKPLSAEEVVSAVERALLTEVRLTPKPGLVDIRNAGAHRDMDLASFEASTAVVAPWMEKFFIMGHDTAAVAPEQVLMMLRPVGMACENDMLEATGGVNTHRGAIFAFGLLSAAAGRLVVVPVPAPAPTAGTPAGFPPPPAAARAAWPGAAGPAGRTTPSTFQAETRSSPLAPPSADVEITRYGLGMSRSARLASITAGL